MASLNCPTCGASAGPGASRCEYCGSTLTSVACPSCFGTMFAGMQFCPHCGAKGSRTVDESTTLPCPGCKGEMRSVTVGATAMFECAACESTWLDADTFTHLCLNREERGAIAAMVGAPDKQPAARAAGGVRYVPCPLCKRIMNRENFGKRSGVIMDVCKGHGVWFERGELQSVMAFINRGGLERARAMEAERLKAMRPGERPREGQTVFGAVIISADSDSRDESLLGEALRMLFS